MKGIVCLVAAAAGCVAACWARDVRRDLWFFADFDSPAQLNGHAFLRDLNPDGFVEGRFGKGYYFHRQARNLLPPMAEFLTTATNFTVKGNGTLKAAGGVLRLSEAGGFRVRPVATQNRPGYLGATGLTCSFYARGAKGTAVSCAVRLSPTDETAVAAALKKKTWGYPSNIVSDRFDTVTCEMDGTWRRVWCVAVHDNRVSQNRLATLAVKATGPLEMKDFQYELTGAYPQLKYYMPSVWVDGGVTSPATWYSTSDQAETSSFPDDEGTFACWTKTSFDENTPGRAAPTWGFHKGWSECRGYQGSYFRVGKDNWKSIFHCGPKGVRTNVWRHVAGTWSKDRLVFYVDGKKTGEYKNPKFDPVAGCPGTFVVGSYAAGSGAGDVILDDFAIFRTALTDEEVAELAAAKKGLLEGEARVFASIVDFPVFWRNQKDAALRMTLTSASEADVTAQLEIGGRTLPGRKLRLARGETRAALAFDPAQYRPGKYPYSYRLVTADGAVALEERGELEIRGRQERDEWTYMSWGGPKAVHSEFAKTAGFNLINAWANSLPGVKKLVREGFRVNLRIENHDDWFKTNLDEPAISAAARKELLPYEGLHAWETTLMNSEVYSAGTAQKAKDYPRFVAMARQAVGQEPDWDFGSSPASVRKPLRGVVAPTNAALETLSWFCDRGDPIYLVNRLTAKVVHRLSPGNIAWTEPIFGAGGIAEGIDGMADWLYCYGTRALVAYQREQYGRIRGVGGRYVPTLSMDAFMSGLDPLMKNELGGPKAVRMCLSGDEMNIYSWIALGATRHDALSLYEADAWEYGVSNALAYVEKGTPVKGAIAEPDAPARHGRFIRETYRPAAMLLKGLENVRAPYAFMRPSEEGFAACTGWGTHHYGKMVQNALMTRPELPFDVLTDREITSDVLAKYRYVVFPNAYLLKADKAKAVAAAARRGTTFVVDGNGAFMTNVAPNVVRLADLHYVHPSKPATVSGPLTNWLASVSAEIAKARLAWSDRDAAVDGSFTFVKERDGVRYVMVVNDGRSDGKCVLNDFKKDADYRPLAAAQRIATTIVTAPGSAVYEFRASRGEPLDVRRLAFDYAPCQARIFTVYPRKVTGLGLALAGEAKAGRTASLGVSLRDAAGASAPGRQLVELTLKGPDGETRDESGLYPMDAGAREIPLRFAADEKPGKWTATVAELTTGFAKTIDFELK